MEQLPLIIQLEWSFRFIAAVQLPADFVLEESSSQQQVKRS